MTDSDYLTPDEREQVTVENAVLRIEPSGEDYRRLAASHAVADDVMRELREAGVAYRQAADRAMAAMEHAGAGPVPVGVFGDLGLAQKRFDAAARRIDAVLNPEPASECERCRSWGAEPLTDGRSWQDCPDCNDTGKKEEA